MKKLLGFNGHWAEDCEVRLTKTGLAVKPHDDADAPFYCSNDSEFRRYMSEEEWDYVKTNCAYSIEFKNPLKHFIVAEKWQFLWSWKISDFTSYKEGTSCNGGDYAFYERHNIFGRVSAGKLELIDVIRYTTSSEFDYDEVHGAFQNGLGKVTFLDCEDTDFCLYTQTNRDEFGYVHDEVWSLNQAGQTIRLQDALIGVDVELVKDEKSNTGQTATHGKIQEEERLIILKEVLGWEPTKRR
jgi:hypothetical protein